MHFHAPLLSVSNKLLYLILIVIVVLFTWVHVIDLDLSFFWFWIKSYIFFFSNFLQANSHYFAIIEQVIMQIFLLVHASEYYIRSS